MAKLETVHIVATVPGTFAEVEIQSRPDGQELSVIFRTRGESKTILRISRLSKVLITGKGDEDANSSDV